MNELLFIRDGEIKTTSLIVASIYGRSHNKVLNDLRALIDEGYIGLSEFRQSYYVNLQNKRQPMYELSEGGFLRAMPFLGGKKAKEGQARLVDAFLELRAELANRNHKYQQELHDFELEYRYSKERASLAGRTLQKRKTEILELSARKLRLESRFQLRLEFCEVSTGK